MSGTAVCSEKIQHTYEEISNVVGVVHTTVQRLARTLIVDSDLKGCGIRQRQVSPKGTNEVPRERVHRVLFSFPNILNSEISVDQRERVSSPEEVALGRGDLELQYSAVTVGRAEEVLAWG